jgi:hypothetical protein
VSDYIPHDGRIQRCLLPLTLTSIEKYLGTSDWKQTELLSGDLILYAGKGPLNERATTLTSRGVEIFGDAILCEPEELA